MTFGQEHSVVLEGKSLQTYLRLGDDEHEVDVVIKNDLD